MLTTKGFSYKVTLGPQYDTTWILINNKIQDVGPIYSSHNKIISTGSCSGTQ